jgi:Pectate lyase superfamily protein/Concanavalin A-like lectin/glucanases superfamily
MNTIKLNSSLNIVMSLTAHLLFAVVQGTKLMRLKLCLALISFCFVMNLLHAENDGLLFHASYKKSTKSELAKGNGALVSGSGKLVKDNHLGNALVCKGAKFRPLRYAQAGNISDKAGTVEFMYQPQLPDFPTSAKGTIFIHNFFAIDGPPAYNGLRLGINLKPGNKTYIWAIVMSKQGGKPVQIYKPKVLHNGRWYKIVFTWNKDKMALFVNDNIIGVVKRPKNIIGGTNFAIGGSNEKKIAHGLIADVKIYDRVTYRAKLAEVVLNKKSQASQVKQQLTTAWKPYKVTDFGAKGDGKTDDTDAIQRCITTVEQQQQQFYKSETAYPEIIFPAGNYLISRPLVIGSTRKRMNLALKGKGKVTITQLNQDQDILYFHYGYRNSVKNITFIGGKRQMKFFSRNYNRAQLVVRNCRFIDSSSYAIDDALKGVHYKKIVDPYTVSWKAGLPHLTANAVDALPDVFFTSSVVHIDRCEFVNCMKVLRVFSDWAILSNSKITTNPAMQGAAIYARGVLKVSDTKCYAKVRTANKQRFVDNINAGVMLENVTLDSDGAGMCPIYNRRFYDNGGMYNSYAVIANCKIKAAGSPENCFVYCEEVPNVISITNSTETSGKTIPAIGFRKPITKEYLSYVSFPEMVKRLPELAQIYGYMVTMPRIYRLEPGKFENNFSLSLYGNKNLDNQIPPVLKQFVAKPLPKKLLAEFKFQQNPISLNIMQKTSSINVASFGAKGDGRTDDTAAIQKAVNTISKQTNTELLFPGRIYKISRTIILPENISIRGLGLACFKGSKGNETLFSGKNINQATFANVGFFNANVGVTLTTDINTEAQVLFDLCSFSKLKQTAVSCLSGKGKTGEKNRTALRITDCVYGVSGRALDTNANNTLFAYNWLSLYDKDVVQGSLLNKGTMQIVDNIGVPSIKAPATWIENHHTVLVDNMRFGGEGKFKKNLIANNSANGKIYMKYSWLYCDFGSIIVCNQIPKVIALMDNFGVPVLKFHTMIEIKKTAKGKLAGHFFESGNIPPVNIKDERK